MKYLVICALALCLCASEVKANGYGRAAPACGVGAGYGCDQQLQSFAPQQFQGGYGIQTRSFQTTTYGAQGFAAPRYQGYGVQQDFGFARRVRLAPVYQQGYGYSPAFAGPVILPRRSLNVRVGRFGVGVGFGY